MKIILKEKYYFGSWQGWEITIDKNRCPHRQGEVYTAKSAVEALSDCFKDRNNEIDHNISPKVAVKEQYS